MNRPDFPPTFSNRAAASSNIDVTLTSANISDLVSGCCVLDGETSSDHNIRFYNLRKDAAQGTSCNGNSFYNFQKNGLVQV